MLNINSDAKLKDLLEFPCSFTFKVMGYAKPDLPEKVLAVIQRHAPGDYTPTIKPSAKGNYHSVSVNITATSIEQVETLYKELGEIDIVRMVL
jgi:putative lipoic acid-binding regulatory protein